MKNDKEIDDKEIEALVGINLDKEPITLPEFKKGDCPTCDKGFLLGRRDNKTFEFLKEDNCILCAQRFIYEKVPR